MKVAHAKAKLVVATALVFVAVVSWLRLERASVAEGFGVSSKSESALPASNIVGTRSEPALARPVDFDEGDRSSEGDSQRTLVAAALPVASSGPPGTLVLSVFDPSILGPLSSFDVRLLSDTRFASERGDGAARDLELALTPGVYAGLVLSPGYEPLELSRVDIRSAETTRLDPIALQPGSGTIRVRVIGDTSSDRKFTVKLAGSGRHPCEHCGEAGVFVADTGSPERADWAWNHSRPCSMCGFARENSACLLRSGESFEFPNLAGGEYALLLTDDRGEAIGEAHRMTLAPRESSSIVFDAFSLRNLEIEIFDVDGRSLSEVWRRRLESKPDVEVVVSGEVVESESFRFAIDSRDREIANATLIPPDPVGHHGLRPSAFGGRKLGTGLAKNQGSGQAVDRARSAHDTLRPASSVPFLAPSILRCELGNDGLVRLGPLPTTALHLRVSTSHASAEADIRESRGDTRVRAQLSPR